MLTIGPIPAWESREVRRLALQCGCRLTETSTGRWWWKEWTFTVQGGALSQFERGLAELERERRWWQAIK